MHELSIAMSLIEVASEEAQRLGASVVALHLRVGVLSGVEKDALLGAYELARQGTPLAQAELLIETVPITAWCPRCRAERLIPSPQEMGCPFCESPATDIRGGRELEVVGLEIIDDTPNAHCASASATIEA